MGLIHKVSIVALVVLSLITAGMLIQHQLQAKHLQERTGQKVVDLQKSYEELMAKNSEIYGDLDGMLKQKQFSSVEEKLQQIKADHPDNPHSFVYQAQLQYGQGKLAPAIHSYRVAVDLEPDYVDKKTPLFISPEIMALIIEARGKLSREKKLKPNDKSIKLALEDMYYLQRRIAGGCE